jgi:hypothetical protein
MSNFLMPKFKIKIESDRFCKMYQQPLKAARSRVYFIIKQVSLNKLSYYLEYKSKTHKHYNKIKMEIIYKCNKGAKLIGLGSFIDRESI